MAWLFIAKNRQVYPTLIGALLVASWLLNPIQVVASTNGADQEKTYTIEHLVLSLESNTLAPTQLNTLLQQYGLQHLQPLYSYLTDSNHTYERRWFAAIAMARVGGTDADDLLLKAMRDKSFYIRMAALKGLEMTTSLRALPEIHRLLRTDEAMVVRAAAANALATIAHSQSLIPLREALDDKPNFHRGKSLWVRKHIAQAIAKIGGVEAIPTLVACLHDHDRAIQLIGLQGLNPAIVIQDQGTELETLASRWKTVLDRDSIEQATAPEPSIVPSAS